MSFIKITEELLNEAFTENGDRAFKSTGSRCLDLFAIAGGLRYQRDTALNLFLRAYTEDPILTLKILFYIRDAREGLGERSIFRLCLSVIANMYPEVVNQLLDYIPEIGRWDDLIVLLQSPLKDKTVKLIKDTLNKDIDNKKNGKPISLLAKWLPSINTSSEESRYYAKQLANALGMSDAEYRKTLSFLRKDMIVENNLRERDYTFDYSKVPGQASLKYQKAFIRNDNDRYQEYLQDVQTGKKKFNAQTLYPYQIVKRIQEHYLNKDQRLSLDTMWNSFNHEDISSKTIVVRDGSGSMCDTSSVPAISVATSLAILFAERLTGEFHNKFITFSSRPELVEVKGNDITEKVYNLKQYNDCSTTDIKKVYDLILEVYSQKDFKKEDALDRIVIISDMEFNCLPRYNGTSYNYFKQKFEELGYDIPEVVFWNVRSRTVHFPVTKKDSNVKLVSGASQSVIDQVTQGSNMNAYENMLQTLTKYDYLDNLVL